MGARLTQIIVLAAVALVTLSSAIFYVDEREHVLLLRLGEVQRADYEPGIHFKIPFVNEVRRFDNRTLLLDSSPSRYLTGEMKNVIVDSFILWRIVDPEAFFTSMSGDEENARLRLGQIIRDGLRGEFGRRTIQQLVSGDRSEMVRDIMREANRISAGFGIEVTNVRIKRIDLPSEVSTSVFARMEAERERVAMDLRSRGAEEAEKIRSDADRQRIVILAEAERSAQTLRGEGDAIASNTYANAYGQNQEFFSLYRRLNAYKNVFRGDDLLVIDPQGEFFNRFSDPLAR
ncbi:HflC protein [Methylophaga lonarensis MPL]|uniref:Protein HflC n=1 Tax=Methylophaga lonarensis MPL TaxID=1286106 RepID=M7P286_9GAMM|nr:protease modulator HflC [Methylophaga lonarensis]EMR13616.1 HflC protein [Methylophaga lonarensis MPL]